jgi:hypothetical protein
VPLLALGTFRAGGGMMLGISLYESTFQRRIPADVLSRVSSYDWFGSLALQPIGLAIWGPIAVAIGIDAALWVAAALLFAVVLAPAGDPRGSNHARRLRWAVPRPTHPPGRAPRRRIGTR